MRSPSEAKRSGPIPVVSICRIRPETANLKGLSKVVEPFLGKRYKIYPLDCLSHLG